MCFLFVVSTLLEFSGVHYFTKVGTGEVPIITLDERDDTDSDDDDDGDDDGDAIDNDDDVDVRNTVIDKNGPRRSSANNNRSTRLGGVTRERIVSRKHVDKWRSRIHVRKIHARALQS